MATVVALSFALSGAVLAYNNGVAKTPPMGWNCESPLRVQFGCGPGSCSARGAAVPPHALIATTSMSRLSTVPAAYICSLLWCQFLTVHVQCVVLNVCVQRGTTSVVQYQQKCSPPRQTLSWKWALETWDTVRFPRMQQGGGRERMRARERESQSLAET